MIAVPLPESSDLRVARQRGVLALLDAALLVADQALRVEHPDFQTALNPAVPDPPPDVTAAFFLVHRIRDLRSLLLVYGAAVRRNQDDGDDDYDDIPF
jgi:hypothetical protein